MKPVLVPILLAGVALGANMPKVGPNYEPPKATTPDSYHQQTVAAGTNGGAAARDWWATLGDPGLTDLIDRAVRANLDLKIASSRVLEARSARRVTRADLLPSITSSDNIQRVRGGLTQGLFNAKGPSGGSSLLAPFETSVYQFGFDSSWEIDFFGGRRRALEAATADVAAIEEARHDALVTLLAEVARNYAELRGFQKRLDLSVDRSALAGHQIRPPAAAPEPRIHLCRCVDPGDRNRRQCGDFHRRQRRSAGVAAIQESARTRVDVRTPA